VADCWKVGKGMEGEDREESVEGVDLRRKERVEKMGKKIHQR
jgi:hypothetical protein